MKAVSFGGNDIYSDEQYKKIQFAMNGLTEAGFSGLDLNDINKFMTGKIARVSPYVGNSSEQMDGSCTPKDMEYMMQMMYAYFTDLNYDEEAFEGYNGYSTG